MAYLTQISLFKKMLHLDHVALITVIYSHMRECFVLVGGYPIEEAPLQLLLHGPVHFEVQTSAHIPFLAENEIII